MAKRSTQTTLSVRQPWAWLLVHGYKDIENRNWSTTFRGRCLIHAGKTFDQDGYEWVKRHFKKIDLPLPSEFERGGIVGWVNITDCVTRSKSKWFFGPYGFVVNGADELPFVPMPGKLKLFEIPAPIFIRVQVTPAALITDSRHKPLS